MTDTTEVNTDYQTHLAWHCLNPEPPIGTISHRSVKTVCGKFAPLNHIVTLDDDAPTCPKCYATLKLLGEI